MENKDQKNIWEERITDFRASGLSLAKWCAKNNVSKSGMEYRLYPRRKNKNHSNHPTTFIPATIVDFSEQAINKGTVILEAGKLKINVTHSTDLNLLRKVIEVLP